MPGTSKEEDLREVFIAANSVKALARLFSNPVGLCF
jgi:hypothetical protein